MMLSSNGVLVSHIVLRDVLGREIPMRWTGAKSGVIEIDPIGALNPGQYQLIVTHEDAITSLRFVVQ